MKLTLTAILLALLAAGSAQAQLKLPAPGPSAAAPAPGGGQQAAPPRTPVAPPNMPDPYTREFHACATKTQELMRGKAQDDPGVIQSWKACFDAETGRQDAKMADRMQRLAKSLTPDEKKRLDASNTDWRRFRNSDCAFAADPKGSAQDAAANSQCIWDRTTERAQLLSVLADAVARRDAEKNAAAAPPPADPAKNKK